MRTVKYFQVSTCQLFIMAMLVGIISASLIMINTAARDYLQLPLVIMSSDNCVSVMNYRNGEAFTCGDVGVVLRNYRVKKN